MTDVEALRSFDHGKRRQKGARFNVSPEHAKVLERKRLVRVLGETAANPQNADGEASSASPAAPASPDPTAKPSGAGDKPAAKKRARAASS